MIVYTLHVYHRDGTCLYYREWSRPFANGDVKANNKLMFGFLFSLKQLVSKISPRKGGGFYACSTNVFKLNYFEPPSGHRFILCNLLNRRSGMENA